MHTCAQLDRMQRFVILGGMTLAAVVHLETLGYVFFFSILNLKEPCKQFDVVTKNESYELKTCS